MRGRAALSLVAAAAIVLGLTSESRAYEWDQPILWLPDLLVGLAWVGASVAVWMSGRRGPALVCAAVGVLWFLGGLWQPAAAAHRGPLVHVLVCFPRLFPRRRTGQVTVIAAYATSLIEMLWQAEVATMALAVGVLGAIALERRPVASPDTPGLAAGGGDRPLAAVAAAWSVVFFTTVLLRSALGADGVVPALLLYEAAAVAVAYGAGWYAVRRRHAVADLVVELGHSPSHPVRDALAILLGDPGLRIGYWDSGRAAYLDAQGTTVVLPPSTGPLRATVVDHEGHRLAVVVHDRSALTDPGLTVSLERALCLLARNTELEKAAQSHLADVSLSRRRLAVTATEERARLERRLDREAMSRLSMVLARLRRDGSGPDEHESVAVDLLDRSIDDLRQLAQGLYPSDLTAGLHSALGALCAGSPVPVQLTVSGPRSSEHAEAAIYFTCAEALANVVKHAKAHQVSISVHVVGDVLVAEVRDDGHGGADVDGSGLVGIRDRVEAMSGRLTVSSGPAGTLLRAEVPAPGAGRPVARH